ncbi:MAG: DinB family protein [Candidatus Thorarchaeota archaeon]|nr:DinB family protein [Candidatus Thorarchaeota archaeon]
MDADKFRSLFEYHFEFNHRIWEVCVEQLSEEGMSHGFEFSHGSIHSLFVHIMSVDDRWFAGLLGDESPGFLDASQFTSSNSIREKWDEVERTMHEYLSKLENSHLSEPFAEGLVKWEVLFHVINHGTHHRAQMYAMLNQMGIKANLQDYALYKMGRI